MPPSIADYAAIGDTHTLALIRRDGSVDWCCWPRFDSPAVFLKVLDEERGGNFRVGPQQRAAVERSYVSGTNVLQSRFAGGEGAVELRDWMPWRGATTDERHAIVRDVRGLSGRCRVDVVFNPTFDFARASARFEDFDGGVVAISDAGSVALFVPAIRRLERDRFARGSFELAAGSAQRVVAAFATRPEVAIATARQVHHDEADDTVSAWRKWSSRCGCDGPYREAVLRSALTLKMLTFAPTGALVAAPTTSLPEDRGGVRNWDYRYAWLRDASLAVYALMALGYHDESQRFLDWIEELGAGWERGEPVRIMYTLDGAAVPRESTLDHLTGFAASRPVRVGNDAYDQLQLDVLGEVVHAAYTCYSAMGWDRPGLLRVLSHLVDAAAARWRAADAGIWELRGAPAHHLNSKLFCWVALDRGVRLARATGCAADTAEWERQADAVRRAILAHGYSEEVGAFTQTLGGRALDASALRLPLTRLLPANDPRMVATVSAIERELTRGGFVLRYGGDDGLPGGEGTFALCTLWLANVLARMGETDRAREYLERVLGAANDVGLLSEEIEADSGELLGNFPQAFTHLGVIDAALAIAEAERSQKGTR